MTLQVPACDRCTQGVMDSTNPHLAGTCGCSCHGPTPALELRYHVPRSQVWARSRGGQSGNVHLELTEDFEHGRLRRRRGQVLCTTKVPWYPRSLERAELERLPAGACARCLEIADRHGLELPCECGAAAGEIHAFGCWLYPEHAPRWPAAADA